ncbi:uncharacterized protein LOC117181548 [Belonocnema kinseyi]|uniref:uncharacterized protein LOC117181548 n=1 Tax=Belonocnema kinseyi TaxID=2817044 RepID=UPI00143D9351|nr:uncharacterized protein LOC117181548 [Belonocnema kinseyi]
MDTSSLSSDSELETWNTLNTSDHSTEFTARESQCQDDTESVDSDIHEDKKVDIFFNELCSDDDKESDSEATDYEDEYYDALDYLEDVQERIAIYPGCHITEEESEVLVMTYASRHHISDAALDDFVRIIDCHLP